jgi:hypothetical protein
MCMPQDFLRRPTTPKVGLSGYLKLLYFHSRLLARFLHSLTSPMQRRRRRRHQNEGQKRPRIIRRTQQHQAAPLYTLPNWSFTLRMRARFVVEPSGIDILTSVGIEIGIWSILRVRFGIGIGIENSFRIFRNFVFS